MSDIDITFDEFECFDEPKDMIIDLGKTKPERLRVCAESVLNDFRYKRGLDLLMQELNLSKEEIVKAYIYYDLDVFAYGNEAYEPLAMRFALHLHNLLKGSWHQNGKRTVDEYVKMTKARTIVDVGFGVPTLYVKNAIKIGVQKIVLCDMFDSAFQFSRKLLESWSNRWSDVVSFREIDIGSGEYAGDFDAYIFQDSLEHAEHSAEYIEKYIALSPANAKFIFSLPIGPIVPVHHITWKSHDDVCRWLRERELNLLRSKIIPVNPKVDLFAEQFDFKFATFLGMFSKI